MPCQKWCQPSSAQPLVAPTDSHKPSDKPSAPRAPPAIRPPECPCAQSLARSPDRPPPCASHRSPPSSKNQTPRHFLSIRPTEMLQEKQTPPETVAMATANEASPSRQINTSCNFVHLVDKKFVPFVDHPRLRRRPPSSIPTLNNPIIPGSGTADPMIDGSTPTLDAKLASAS